MDKETKTGIITIYDGWIIVVDDKQFVLEKETGRFRKDTGKPVYNVYGYYTRLAKALEACCEANIHLRLQSGSVDLRTALHVVIEEHDRMKEFIAANIPDA